MNAESMVEADPILAAMRIAATVACALLTRASGEEHNVVILTCPQGTKDVHVFSNAESEEMLVGMASVFARQVMDHPKPDDLHE